MKKEATKYSFFSIDKLGSALDKLNNKVVSFIKKADTIFALQSKTNDSYMEMFESVRKLTESQQKLDNGFAESISLLTKEMRVLELEIQVLKNELRKEKK